ncbi:MAG: hypothetical protein JWN57_2182, partial [Frankiales bacterium]|nr:hypothetical protein [Frankiales bacterium]
MRSTPLAVRPRAGAAPTGASAPPPRDQHVPEEGRGSSGRLA